ncbi:MAG TPA: GTPase Era [Synergistales bacterium]|nr:GTPase Era [Synergistales bacterium]
MNNPFAGIGFHAGNVVLAGRPNVGKSSLVNRLLDYKVSIVSEKPQTTRNVIRCVYNGEDFQIIFSDTPGIHLPKHKLGRTLVDAAVESLEEADLVCYVVEAEDRTVAPEDEEILSVLGKVRTPVLLVVNKCDVVLDRKGGGEAALAAVRSIYEARISLCGVVFVSARMGRGLDTLIAAIRPHLPEGPPFYDEDILVDRPEKFIAAEIIREKVLLMTHREVPHSVAVEIEEYKSPDEYPERDVLFIRATLYVEREGQKRIVIGDSGARLKEIGRRARMDIETLTGHKVYLDLWIKVRKDWRQSDADLRMLGIQER